LGYIQPRTCAPPRRVHDDAVSPSTISLKWASTIAEIRSFIKPLRYDARRDVAFPNVLLLDSGSQAVPLHIVSPFMDPKERQAKEAAISGAGPAVWSWRTTDSMPPFPEASARRSG